MQIQTTVLQQKLTAPSKLQDTMRIADRLETLLVWETEMSDSEDSTGQFSLTIRPSANW